MGGKPIRPEELTNPMNCPNCNQPLNIGKLLGHIKSPARKAASRANGKKGGRPPTAIDLTDMAYVESVLAGRVASCVPDGELLPPKGAACQTRSGFREWLRRAKKQA